MVTAADGTTKYYQVIAKEGLVVSIPNASGRVIVFNYPLDFYSPESELDPKPAYNAELYAGEFTAATFNSSSNIPSNEDAETQSLGNMVEVIFDTGGTPNTNSEYVLLLKNAGSQKYVGYFNGVKFTDGIAMVAWNDMWHTFEEAIDFSNFMNNPDLPTGNDYRIALSKINMEELSKDGSSHLYGLMKSPYTYRFDFRGCTGTSFTSAPNHSNAAQINEVHLNPDLITVGDYAFDGCTKLSEIELPSGVTTVGDYAFRSTKLESIDFSKCTGLTRIGASAFYSCTSLKTVALSNTKLTTIGAAAFNSCGNLTTMDLSPVAPTLQSIGSVSDTPPTNSSGGVFAGCTKLSTVNLSDCTQLKTIGDYAFYNCSQFTDAVNLTNSKDNLQKIGSNAFNLSRIISLNLKECTKLETIGNSAFASCTALTTADLSECKELTAISDSTFMTCTSLATADLSDCIKLETIDNKAFSGCNKLAAIELSECTALAAIGDSAFMTCTSLATVDLSDCTKLETIGNQAFSGCNKLAAIELSECKELKTIGASAFSGSGLTSFVLENHNKLTNIGNYAFYNCASLATVELKGWTAPASASIGAYAFAYCGNLEDVKLIGWTGLTSIGDSAFASCSKLGDVNMSGCTGLASIGSSAFSGSGPAGENAKLSVNMSGCNSLATIGNQAFYNCTALATVDLGGCSILDTIDSYAFSSCSVLATVKLNGSGLKNIGDTSLTSSYTSYGAFAYCAKLTTIDLSSCAKLETIGNYAFYNSGLTSFNLPNHSSLNTISTQAFSYCTTLATVNLSGCNNLDTVGNAFSDCAVLTTVNLNECSNLASIASFAFSGCSKLEDVKLTGCAALDTIDSYAFSGCIKLATVTLTDTVIETIGDFAFSDCTMLTDVLKASNLTSIKNTLTSIGVSAFEKSGVTIADLKGCINLLTIGASAFATATQLGTLTLPATLASVGDLVFSSCGSTSDVWIYIKDITNLNTIFSGGNIFGIKQGFTLHVPNGTKDAYTTLWSNPNHTAWQTLLETSIIEDAN
jgi:hypothetical protein